MDVPTLSHKTQLQLVRLLTGWTVREIEELFAGNGLIERSEALDERQWPVGESVRRDLAARYLAAVSPGSGAQRVQLLRVFADVLRGSNEDEAEYLAELLAADGVGLVSPTRIDPALLRLPDDGGRLEDALPDFTTITDTDVLREHAERIQRASVSADPPDAILAARELLETVCKLVCEDYGVTVPKNPNAGELYKLAADPLGLDARSIAGDDEAAKASRKVLSGLVRVADGLGDLRTRVGRGHGRTSRSSARQRHAELATGAAATLAVFLLDTWRERRSRER